MARTLYNHRIEVFAFAATGLPQALREAAHLLEDPRNKDLLDATGAEIQYRSGTHYVVLPYIAGIAEDDSYGASYEA